MDLGCLSACCSGFHAGLWGSVWGWGNGAPAPGLKGLDQKYKSMPRS